MAKARTISGRKFPFEYKSNGRTGKVYKLGNGTFKTHFQYAGENKQNTFGSFARAHAFLAETFSKLDTDSANSVALHPLNSDVRDYRELEQLLRNEGDGATLRDAVTFFLTHRKTKKMEPKKVAECVDLFLEHQRDRNVT